MMKMNKNDENEKEWWEATKMMKMNKNFKNEQEWWEWKRITKMNKYDKNDKTNKLCPFESFNL